MSRLTLFRSFSVLCYIFELTSIYALCRLQGNLTMWSMRTRMNSLEYTTLEIQLSMNASIKSSKLTRMEYLSVSQTTLSIKYTSEVSLSTVSLWNASVIIFLPQNTAASFYQCPNKGGVVIWGPSIMAILCPEKGPKQDDRCRGTWQCPGFPPNCGLIQPPLLIKLVTYM